MAVMKRIIFSSFKTDIAVLLVVSIIVGAALSGFMSLAVNAYFSKTVSSLVGEYGEYDLIIQAREEMKEDTAVHLQKIVDEAFGGAKIKEGPTLNGKTSFFIALPDKYKTKAVYEELGKTFGSVPGGAGVGVVTEPRLTIRGVPEGAKTMLIEKIGQLKGVRFAFRDGSSVGVVLTGLEASGTVSSQIKAVIEQYQVIEVSFPVGSEPQNPIRLGESIAAALQEKLQISYARNVSVDGRNDDMTYLVSTMMELKRFLAAYAAKVTIVPAAGETFHKGDVIAFAGKSSSIAAGMAVNQQQVLVQVVGLRGDGSAEGIIMQGDAGDLLDLHGYRVENKTVGAYCGMAGYRNPRRELTNALGETAKLVGQIPAAAADAQTLSNTAAQVLDRYSSSLTAAEKAVGGLQDARAVIQSTAGSLTVIDTAGLQNQVDNSAKAMSGLINTMQVLKLISGEAGNAADSLTAAQRNLLTLKQGLGAVDQVAREAQGAALTVAALAAKGESALAVLREFDAAGARRSTAAVSGRLEQLNQLNVPLVSAQLQYLAAAVPDLKDEEINRSAGLLDKFIAGQVIPGERIQILIAGQPGAEAVTPLIYQQVGNNAVSVYTSGLGVIEPNPRGEMYRILNEIKAILAAVGAVVFTLLFLLFDHTAIMTFIKHRCGGRWPAALYGGATGALLLTAMFFLAGGAIPYLPWLGVPLLGAIMGWLAAAGCEKINPLSAEELLAGQALGLSADQILREIVIPSGRPGLLQRLNRSRQLFR